MERGRNVMEQVFAVGVERGWVDEREVVEL
jgi:hypothetical protein